MKNLMKNRFALLNSWLVSPKPWQIKILGKFFQEYIPFNGPHKITIHSINPEGIVETKMPFIRRNKNHLEGMHACAITTLGEFSAGIALISRFSPEKYRVILAEIESRFTKQGRGELRGISSVEENLYETISLELEEKGKSDIRLKTEIFDKENEKVAEIKTLWQLKEWGKVRFQS